MVPSINYLAVLVAAVAGGIALGSFWYGALFGKHWIKMMGWTQEQMEQGKKSMGTSYALAFAGSFIMAWVMAHSLIFANEYFGTSGWSSGLMAGFWNWIGYVVPVTLSTVLWEGRSWKLWALNTFYYLASLSIMGVILAVWM